MDDNRRRRERCEESFAHAAEPRRVVLAVRGTEESGGSVARDDVRGAHSGLAAGVQPAAQRAVLETNPDLPFYSLRRFEDVVSASQIREVATMRTLTAFAAIALVLAIAGTYAMLMFAVVQRSRELALRQAVGATARISSR